MDQRLLHHAFENGLVLLGEPMPWLRSAAFAFLLPAGTRVEPLDRDGLAGMTSEMVQRGCGDLDSRQFLELLDGMGVERGTSITTNHTAFSCAMPCEVLPRVLNLYADMVRRPSLPEPQLEDARLLCLQELRSLDDDPSHLCFTELKHARYPFPYGRIAQGTRAGLEAIDAGAVRGFVSEHYKPQGSLLAIAGNFDWDEVRGVVERAYGDWNGAAADQPAAIETLGGARDVPHASNQTHLALAYDCVSYESPDYYQTRALVGVLSDGMSSRLFTEVREKRGLVYSVFATCHSLARHGSVLCYAGTTAARADETLRVLVDTIQSLGEGVSDDELERLKYRVKSSLVFEQESSSARSHQIASDWYHLGRVPSREEVCAKIDALSRASLLEHFHRYPPENFSLVAVGPQALELPHGIADAHR